MSAMALGVWTRSRRRDEPRWHHVRPVSLGPKNQRRGDPGFEEAGLLFPLLACWPQAASAQQVRRRTPVSYHTQDSGKALYGSIDNNTFSVHLGMTLGNQTLIASMQKVNGNTPFNYILDGDSIYLDNSQQWSDFNAPGEKSWKLQYVYDFAGWGLSGLTSSISYIRGTMDLTQATTAADSGYSYYNPDGRDAKHWERDADIKYTVQGGAAKYLSVRLR